jgi:hypothetical protein
MAIHQTCDGVVRRDFLKAGVIGATGLTLARYLELSALGAVSNAAKAKAAIFVNLPGGPSHMDTFDLKPGAPAEYRGLFNPIKTNADGVEICEHLPRLAKCADKFVLLRGVSHALGAHALGQEYVNTGTRPIPSLQYPGYGSIVAKELASAPDLPPYVAIPNHNFGGGYLGVKYAPLATGAAPRQGQPFTVRGVALQGTLTVKEVEKRQALLNDLDKTFAGFEANNQLLDGLDRFGQQAYAMITSRRAREAFDVSKESSAFAEPFGASPFGMSCLLATRLVEAGVRFCTVSLGGWDTHANNFPTLKDRLLPQLDTGLAALFGGLATKGLLEETAVFVTGEFGRTPKINNRSNPGGRDHYPRCMCMLLAGGGILGGRVLGESDEKATAPKGKGFTPDDVAASFLYNLGIDPQKEYPTATGRPITIIRDGHVIRELFS